MVALKRLSLIATIATVHQAVSAQLQKPLLSQPEDLLEIDNTRGKPLVDTELLQASFTTESLLERAKALYGLAKSSEDEFGHPTRVIGSEGKLLSTSSAQYPD
jgi:aminopeptidase Y